MSWLFSPALVEAYSQESSSDGAACAPLSVMPTEHPFCHNDKLMASTSPSRFGLTWKVLTADRGEELLTSFRAASRVRTYPRPAKVSESGVSKADCGEPCFEWFAKFNPATSSWKIRQLSLFEDLDESLETWPRWGTMRNGECFPLPTLEHDTSVKECSSLPTPRANDAEKRGDFDPTNPRNGLPAAVRRLPTPTCADAKNIGPNNSSQDNLHKISPLPLNPEFVEQMMGFPSGTTGLKPLATLKCLNRCASLGSI